MPEKKQKLEQTWIGKENRPRQGARLGRRHSDRRGYSYGVRGGWHRERIAGGDRKVSRPCKYLIPSVSAPLTRNRYIWYNTRR